MLEIVEGYNFKIKVGLNPQEEDSFGVIVATKGVVNVAIIVIVAKVVVEVIKVVIVGVVAKVVNVVNSHQAFLPLPSIL